MGQSDQIVRQRYVIHSKSEIASVNFRELERNKRSGDIAANKSYINSEQKHKVRLVTFVRNELISIQANWPLLRANGSGELTLFRAR